MLLPCVNIHLEISKVILLGRVLLAFESKVVWNEGEMLQANQQIDSSFLSPLIIVTLYTLYTHLLHYMHTAAAVIFLSEALNPIVLIYYYQKTILLIFFPLRM